jgi:hypothetical protein
MWLSTLRKEVIQMRTVNGLVLAVVLAFGVPAVVNAQAQPPDTRQAAQTGRLR